MKMMLASSSQEIKFHDWETSSLVGVYKPYSDKSKQNIYFTDLTWSCDGTFITGVQSTGKALLLKPPTNVRNDLFIPEKDIINCSCVKGAQFSRTRNNLLALGTSVGHLVHYNLVSKYSHVLVHDFPGSVHKVCYGANDSYIGTACANGQIFVVQAGIGITEAYFIPGSENVTALTTHPLLAKYMAGGSDRGVIAVWDVTTSSIQMQTGLMNASVLDIAFSPTDDTITVVSSDQMISIYDQRLKERVHEKQFDLQLTTIAYAPRGNEIAVGTDQGHILSMDKRYLRSCRSGTKAHDTAITKIRFQYAPKNKFDYMHQKASGCNVFQEPEREQRQTHVDPFGGLECDVACNLLQEDKYNKSPLTDTPMTIRQITSIPYDNNPEKKPPGAVTPTQQAVENMATFHIIDERSLREFKESVIQSTKDLVDKVVEQVNADFLKMRMNVSREFCNMELRNRERWQELDETMLTLACIDDSQISDDIRMAMIHEEAVRDTTSHRKLAKVKKAPPIEEHSDIDFDDDDEIDEEVTFDDNQSVESAGIIHETELNQMDYFEFDNDLPKRPITSYLPALPPGMGYSSEMRSPRKEPLTDEKKHLINTKSFVSRIPTQKTLNA